MSHPNQLMNELTETQRIQFVSYFLQTYLGDKQKIVDMIVKLSPEFSDHLKDYLVFVQQGTNPSIATYYLGAMTRSFLDERIVHFNRRMRSMQLAIVVEKIETDVEIMCDLTKQACQELCKEVNRTFLMTLIRTLYTHIREEVGTSSQGFSSD